MGRACNDNNNNNNRLSFAEVQYFVLKGSRYKWRWMEMTVIGGWWCTTSRCDGDTYYSGIPVKPLLKDTPHKGHNRKDLNIKTGLMVQMKNFISWHFEPPKRVERLYKGQDTRCL